MVALGAYRVEWAPILAGLSVLTMTVGNVIALRQTSVKRMLAYSSVAQAGYILMGLTAVVSSQQADLTVLGMNGLNGLLLYLFAYLFTNIGALLVVLAVEDETGSTELDAYSNLVQRAGHGLGDVHLLAQPGGHSAYRRLCGQVLCLRAACSTSISG